MPTTTTQRKKIAALYLQLGTLEETLDNCHALLISLLAQTEGTSPTVQRRRMREAAKATKQKGVPSKPNVVIPNT